MPRIESLLGHYPRALHLADSLLPEKSKGLLRRLILGEKYPLEHPVSRELNGYDGKFWINNASDWYRIVREGFENDYAIELLNSVKPGEVFLDVGSAQGFYSIFAAKAGAEVYAMDPDPVSVLSIDRNISLNQDVQNRIHVLNMGLGAKSGNMTMNIDPHGTYASSLRRTCRGLSTVINVEIKTADDLIADDKMKPPDVVKIDVEGAEGLVLTGMKSLLTSYSRPAHLFMELHPLFLPQFGLSKDMVLQQIADIGYVPNGASYSHREKELYHFSPGRGNIFKG
ncbi:MAG: FkbM family methyltransferase [Candidatus Roizmanbacteria bacterium]